MRVLSILTVSAACAVSASASSLRQLEAMASPPLNCIIENGFDYVGNDISNAQGAVTSCCSICASVLNCTAWSWSNHNGGTCWLKSGRGDVVVSPNVKSALQAYTKPPFCVYQNDVDFVGNDLARVSSPNVEGCCDICQKYACCRAYSWSDHLGGSCWLKSKAGQAVYKAGVKSANAYPDIPASCSALEYGLDFVGNDIANKPGIAPGDCCDVCKNTNGCRSFSWSDHNGGTCWLKSAKGSTVYKAGVTSAQVFPNPPPQCSLENNVDYVGNDIGNVANKDAAACCGICRDRNGCHAFSWSDYNGGTCWLKSGKGATATKAGVKSAVLQ